MRACCNARGPIAGRGECLHQSDCHARVERIGRELAPPLDRLGVIATSARRSAQRLERAGVFVRQLAALFVDPALDLRRPGEMDTVERRARVELRRAHPNDARPDNRDASLRRDGARGDVDDIGVIEHETVRVAGLLSAGEDERNERRDGGSHRA